MNTKCRYLIQCIGVYNYVLLRVAKVHPKIAHRADM